MPSHYHRYQKFFYCGTYTNKGSSCCSADYPYGVSNDFLCRESTDSQGGGKAHNNMPPYLTANCWRRTG